MGIAGRAKCGEAAADSSLLAGRAKDRANTILAVKRPEKERRTIRMLEVTGLDSEQRLW